MLVFVSSLDFGNISIAVNSFHLETEVTKTSWTVILSNCYPRLEMETVLRGLFTKHEKNLSQRSA